MKENIVIGLTGPSGAGKSTICSNMKNQGFTIIDADQITKNILDENQSCKNKLALAFGKDILDPHLNINRRRLAKKAFSSKEFTDKLNEITHPYIVQEIKDLTAKCVLKGRGPIIIDAALLFECGLDCLCDKTIAVLSEINTRKARIIKRDTLSEYEVNLRINAQNNELFYHKADFIIYNDKSTESLIKNFIAIFIKIRESLNETST